MIDDDFNLDDILYPIDDDGVCSLCDCPCDVGEKMCAECRNAESQIEKF